MTEHYGQGVDETTLGSDSAIYDISYFITRIDAIQVWICAGGPLS